MKTLIIITTMAFKFSLFTVEQRSTIEDIEYVNVVQRSLKKDLDSKIISKQEYQKEYEEWNHIHMSMYYKLYLECLKTHSGTHSVK